MSQEDNCTRRQSFSNSSSSSSSKPPRANDGPTTSFTTSSTKSSHRYSSPVNPPLRTTPRHYASPEESDAVLPVFTTPTHMYIKQELNPQRYNTPSPKQQCNASPQQQYSPSQQQQQQQNYFTDTTTQPKTFASNGYYDSNSSKPPGSPLSQNTNQYGRSRGESSPTRPTNMDSFGMKSKESEVNNMSAGKQPDRNAYSTSNPTTPNGASPSLSQKDMLLAQLVDMGFTLEASRLAMAASGGTNLQEILDILVQDAKAEKQIPTRSNPPPPSARTSNPPPQLPRHSNPPPPRNSSNPPPPPATARSVPPATKNSDDEDDDPRLEREKEAQFEKEQEKRRKEYLEQLKREKPIPPTPSPRPAPRSPSPPLFTPDTTTVYADRERKQGNYLFNKGQFAEAEAAYSLAINVLPPGHGELVLLSNNRAAARLKQGKYHECLFDCSVAIDVARKQMAFSTSMGDTTWKVQMIKALHRKACALEGLCLFEAAIQVYEEYVRLDGSRSAQVTQSIMRCQQALLDSKKQQQQGPQPPPRPTNNGPSWKPANDSSAFPDIDFNMFIPKQTPEQKAALKEINKSKAVKEMRDREKKKEAEDAERLEKVDKVNAQISVWKTGKDKNLRALLGSLESILWPGVQWKGVMMSELLEPRKCKVTYMKAIAKVHPDKLSANATVEQRMLASGIFTTLNQAWDVFKAENNL